MNLKLKTVRMAAVVGLWGIRLAQICSGQTDPDDQPINTRSVIEPTNDWSIPEQPWYSDPAIRKELDLDDQRYSRLQSNYQKSLERYQQGLKKIDPSLSDEERMKYQNELRTEFNRGVHKSTQTAITDPVRRQRYNQLYWQHQGLGAFNDDDVRSRMRLNDTQAQRIRKLERDWNDRMSTWRRDYSKDPDQVLKRYNEGRAEYNEGLRSVLEPTQLEGWNELTGTPYDFPPELYINNNRVPRPVLR